MLGAPDFSGKNAKKFRANPSHGFVLRPQMSSHASLAMHQPLELPVVVWNQYHMIEQVLVLVQTHRYAVRIWGHHTKKEKLKSLARCPAGPTVLACSYPAWVLWAKKHNKN